MRLVKDTTLEEIVLPDLLWQDEFDWEPVKTSATWGVEGSLILQKGVKLAGRPITLRSPGDDMGWVLREVLLALYSWAADPTTQMTLYLEKAPDTRSFVVQFGESPAINASPVKGWADHQTDDNYVLELKLIQVA